MASALVLAAAVPLVIAGGALLSLVVAHNDTETQIRGLETAQLISYTGAQHGLARLHLDETFEGDFEVATNGGISAVEVISWATDGVDNDDNGFADDAFEEDLREIRSRGYLNATRDAAGALMEGPGVSYVRDTKVIAEKIDLDLSFAQTIYIDDPAAGFELNGGAFVFSGNDVDMDGGPGDESSRPAVGVNGDPAGLLAQVNANQQDKIFGSLPDPAIGETDALYSADFQDILQPLATVTWADGTSYSGDIGNISSLEGEIVYAEGDLKLHGTTTGAGILYVDGDLEISGHFDFAGVIIVRGNVALNGGGGAKELHGSLLLWGDSDDTSAPDLRVSGSVLMEYSSEALEAASGLIGFKVLFWKES
jgi:hypothetical protein